MKRFFREVEAIWRRTLHRRSQKAGMFMPRFLRLLRRFPLPKPTILNPYRSVIQELTKIPMNHEAPLASNKHLRIGFQRSQDVIGFGLPDRSSQITFNNISPGRFPESFTD